MLASTEIQKTSEFTSLVVTVTILIIQNHLAWWDCSSEKRFWARPQMAIGSPSSSPSLSTCKWKYSIVIGFPSSFPSLNTYKAFQVFPCCTMCSLSARDWHFSFETSRFRNFCQIFEGFGFGIFGFGKKVSVSVSKKFGLGKKSRYWFRKIWFRKKSQFRFRTNLVSEKKKSK